jgi:small subunit ribosomal protein S17
LENVVPAKTQNKKQAPAPAAQAPRAERRTVTGVVTSDKMDKTIRVEVERIVKHPAFEKRLRRSYVCYAHDEKGEAKSGDRVELMESRPLSKLKHWRLVRVVAKAAAAPAPEAGGAPAAKGK